MLKLVIFGSRNFNDYEKLKKTIEQTKPFHEGRITHIICGMAKGADLLGKRWAEEHGYEVIEMPADWARYGKSAGYIRNAEMAKIADGAIGFWDGESKGTKHMIDICNKNYVPLFIARI